MTWALAIGGALLGLLFATETMMLGFVTGALVGYLLASVIRLRRRVEELEDVERARAIARPSIAERAAEAPARTAAPTPPAPAAPKPMPAPVRAPAPAAPTAAAPAPIPIPPAAQPIRPPLPAEPTPVESAFRFVRDWFTTGNVPVKLGVIISFFGVAFLLKYAVDRRLLVFPIEFRLLAVAAVAAVLLAIGWRLRDRKRVYALSLQGGGLGILYLTTFAAFRLYELIPPVFAFALLVVLTVAGGALAVLQNARGLATLGAVGGFLAPVLVSTGSGNHVVLFSYYLVLNAMILGIAWYRPWRELNLIGFAFTFVIGGLWAWERYEPDKYASTQPFVILFFLFYQAVAILFARRSALAMKGVVDGTLVFGTPVLVFAMQAHMLGDTEFGLAYSAVAAALFYAVTATLLDRERSPPMRLLVESYLALAVAFATLAIPLALDARWTAAGWALEGAALVWIGVRQQRVLARLAGALLVFGAGVSFLDHGWRALEGPPFLNGNLLGGWMIAVSALLSSCFLARVESRWQPLEKILVVALCAWGFLWWAGAGTIEIIERVAVDWQSALIIVFYPLSALLLTLLARRPDWKAAGAASLVSLLLLALLGVFQSLLGEHPFDDCGFAAWPVAIAIVYGLLRRQAQAFLRLVAIAHPLAAALVAAIATAEVHWQLQFHFGGEVWATAAASFVPGLLLLAVFGLRGRWPVAAHRIAYTIAAAIVFLTMQWLLVLQLNTATNGDPAPLPFLPVANPVDLATGFALLCTWFWLRGTGTWTPQVRIALGGAAFLLSTVALLRGMHHLVGVAWEWDAMLDSVLVQAAISVYWGLLAFGAMTFGARRAHRGWWMVGAGLMGLVVVKLFLVELGNTGTVARIVSFIAIGGLLLVLGYVAPVPPRERAAESTE